MVLAYIFERFPKRSQTFCYREVAELFRQGTRPHIFSLRAPEQGGEWAPDILSAVQALPEGDAFARLADEAQKILPREARKILRRWRGHTDSLRLHQAAYIGVRLRALGVTRVHAHFAGMAARTAFWIREFFGVPYSLTVHANDIFAPNNFVIGLSEIFGNAHRIIAVSDFAAKNLRHRFPTAADKISRVYNGIDLAEYAPAHFEKPPLIISVGRLIHKKGFDVLIDACARLREIDFRCEIIGDGPLRGGLIEQIRARALDEFVSLPGTQAPRQIAARLSEATVFVLPCRVEADGAMDNLPTVIMEAMAASLPVISTNVGGVNEMVRDGETGILAPQNDTQTTADAIAELLRDIARAREFGARGRERCAQLFSIEKNVAALRQLLL